MNNFTGQCFHALSSALRKCDQAETTPEPIARSPDYDDLASHLADLSTPPLTVAWSAINAANFSRFSRGRWRLRRHNMIIGGIKHADGLPPL